VTLKDNEIGCKSVDEEKRRAIKARDTTELSETAREQEKESQWRCTQWHTRGTTGIHVKGKID